MSRVAILLTLACVLLGIAAAHASAATRAFGAPRFQTNDTGAIVYSGNTLSTCADGSSAPVDGATQSCAQGRAGGNLYNNQVPNQRINVAGIGADNTANSSSSRFTLPAGAQVTWAGLYWGADAGSTDAANVPNPARTIQLRVPGSTAFQTVTATQFDQGAPQNHENGYQGFADVTATVKAAGSGTYTAGGIPLFAPTATNGSPNDSYGGWTLVVVTKDPAQPSRNLSVFDGFESVNTTNQPTINVTGFLTPPTGQVNTELGIIAYEGDRGLTGDFAQLNGTNLGDSANPATNFFNSTQTTLGNRRAGLNPDYDNTFGYDADIFDASGRLANGATSASIKLGSTGDVYAPGVVTLATELYAPKFTPRKTVENLSRSTGATQRGDLLRYTVSYENTGGDAAAGMRIDDAIPAGTTYDPGSLRITSPGATTSPTDAVGDDTAEYDAANRVVRFRPGTGGSATSGGTVAVGQTATVTFNVRANANLADNTRVDNVATASYRASTSGTGFTDLPTPAATTIVRAPDLQIAKTITSGPITAGQPAQFALSVTNAGGAPTSGTVTVTDTVPANAFPTVRGASGSGWTCSVAGQTVTCTRSDPLAGGAGYPPILIDVTAANNLPTTVQNDTTVAGGGDSNTTNNTGTATGPGTNRADLNVSKKFGRSSAVVGGTVSWTIEVRNDGPSDATGATVSDQVPAGLNVTSVTSTRGTCSAAATNPIACNLGTIPNGSNAVVTVTATVAGTPRTITNTATATSTVTDPNTANNSSSSQLVVDPSADLRITKSGPTTAPNAGTTAYSFTLTVRNNGPDAAQNVNVIDAIPDNFTVSGTPTATGGLTCNTTAQRVSCTAGTLASGATSTITISGTSSRGGLVTNSATVDATTADPDTSNNAATAVVRVGTLADLSVAKSFSTGTAAVATGATSTVTLAVTNGGPSDATGVVARDTLPDSLTFVSSAGNACTAAGQVVTCAIGDLAGNATASPTFVVRVNTGATGTAVNTGTVTSDVADPFPGNNSSTARLPITAVADMSVTNTADVATASVGDTVTWTATGTNNGPSVADNPRFTVQLPPGVSGIAITSGAADCTIDQTARTVTCQRATLASGASIPVTFTGVVGDDLAGKTLLDPATVTSDTGDPNLANNAAQASVAINPAYRLTVTKVARDATVAPNQATTFDINVRNAGPSDATNVTVTDTLPASTTFVAADAGCAVDGGVVTCAVDRIAAGATATRTVTVRTTTANAGSPITNAARYSTNDPEGIDKNKNQPANSDTATVAVSTIADLQVTNTPNRTSAGVGDAVSWTVVGRNNGPNPAVNATFTVQLPANVDDLTITANNANCTRTGQLLTCSPGTLANGDTASVTFGGTVARAAAGTTLTDPARITSDTADPAPGNNDATGAIAITRRYELSVDKIARDQAVDPGALTTFDLRINNAGPNAATGISLVDRLPANTVYVSGSAGCAPDALGTTVTCAVGTVAANSFETRQITIRTSAQNAGTSIVNQLTYLAPDGADVDVNKNNPTLASDTASVNVNADADLAVTNVATVLNPRADGSAEPGGAVRWNVVATNQGPSPATNAVLTVTVPAGVDISSVVLDPQASQGCTISVSGRTITCLRATLPQNATIPLTFSGNVTTASAGSSVVVAANIDSDTGDLRPANNDASSTVRVGRRYALTLTKTAVDATVQPGDNASFDLNIANDGPSDATNVTLTDTLPAGTTFVSAAAGCTPNGAGTAVTCVVDVPAGQTVTRRITVQAPNSPGTTLTNTATYTTADPVEVDVNKNTPARNTGTAQVAIAPRADLAVTIDRTPGSPAPVVGGPISFTVVGTNNGPNTAVNPTLRVEVPAGITITGVGTGCSFSGQIVTCSPDTLAPNGTIQTVITGTVTRPLAGQTISVPASITSTTVDPDTSNNNATATATIGRRYELSVQKTADQTRVGPGQDIRYTLRITNDGPNDATGVNLVDPLPANTTLVSATQGCTFAGNPVVVTCPVGDLANGASATREITVRTATAAAGTTVTNSATYTTPDGPAVDVNRGTPAATGTASVQVTPLVDLGITKTVTPGRVTAGGEVVYTLDVVNNGPNGATGVVVADDLPDGLTVLQTAPTQGTCSVGGRAVRCAIGDVAAGGRAQVIIRARADSAGTVVNKATITSDQADSNPTDNTSSEVPLVIDPAPAPPAAPPAAPAPAAAPADLVLNKELVSRTVTVGRVLTYRITVTNKGGSVARGVRVTDVPSRTLDVLGVKPTVGSCPGRSPITCDLGDLAPGQSAQVTVSVRANAPGKLSNAATAVAAGSPEVPAETDVADTSVRRLPASVSVKKTASARTVRGGSSVRFTIRVKNFTRRTVRKVLVCDTLPRGLVFQKASPLKVTGRKACGTIATLKAGQVRTFVVTVRAESRKTAKTLTNAARAVVPNELSSKASRAVRVTPGPAVSGDGGVTG